MVQGDLTFIIEPVDVLMITLTYYSEWFSYSQACSLARLDFHLFDDLTKKVTDVSWEDHPDIVVLPEEEV